MKIKFYSFYTKVVLVMLLIPVTNFAQDKLKVDYKAYDGGIQ